MRKLLLSVTVLAVLFTSCKDKLEKKDKTLSDMQNEDGNPNNYVPVLSTASESPVYKKINDTVDMHLNIYYPEKHKLYISLEEPSCMVARLNTNNTVSISPVAE